MECIFCKIVSGEIPCQKVYEDDDILAFYDLEPQAPIHVLIIPKQHIESSNDINYSNSKIIACIFEVIPKLAKKLDLNSGYRIVSNCMEDAGQTVKHIHFHILGGRKFTWPPG